MKLVRIATAGLVVAGAVTFLGAVTARPASAATVQMAACPGWVTSIPVIGFGAGLACSTVPGTTAPTPGMPGRGTAGTFDSTPTGGTSDYDQYAYSNLDWPLYDEGSTVLHPIQVGGRTIDDTIGNGLLGLAVDIDAGANGLQKLISPPKFLGQLDRVVAVATNAVNEALWTPYSAVAILILAIMIGWRVWRFDLASATSSTVWMLLVIGLVSFATLQSTQISSSADKILPQITDSIYAHIDGSGPDAKSAAANEVENDVFIPLWCQGELGSTTSKVAVAECPILFHANGYSWAEANSAGNGIVKPSVTKAKEAQWQQAAGIVHHVDPDAYAHMTDASAGRTSAGALALLYSLSINVLRIVAYLMTLIALVVLRFAIAIFPAVALIGVNDRWSSVIHGVVTSVVAALVGAVSFSVVAALAILFDSYFLNPAYLPRYVGAALAAFGFWVAWRKMRPTKALAGMLGVSGMERKAGVNMKRYRRKAMRHALEAAGAGAAAEHLIDRHHEREEREEESGPAYRPESQPAPRVPDVEVRPSQPEPVIPPLSTPAWVDDDPLHPTVAPVVESEPVEAEVA